MGVVVFVHSENMAYMGYVPIGSCQESQSVTKIIAVIGDLNFLVGFYFLSLFKYGPDSRMQINQTKFFSGITDFTACVE